MLPLSLVSLSNSIYWAYSVRKFSDNFFTIYDSEQNALDKINNLKPAAGGSGSKIVNLKKLDMYIIEIMSFLLESEMSRTYKIHEIKNPGND